jgi:hypothetical protein
MFVCTGITVLDFQIAVSDLSLSCKRGNLLLLPRNFVNGKAVLISYPGIEESTVSIPNPLDLTPFAFFQVYTFRLAFTLQLLKVTGLKSLKQPSLDYDLPDGEFIISRFK